MSDAKSVINIELWADNEGHDFSNELQRISELVECGAQYAAGENEENTTADGEQYASGFTLVAKKGQT